MNDYERLTEEVNKMRKTVTEDEKRLGELEAAKERAWEALDDVQLAHVIHAHDHDTFPNSGYCGFNGCRFYQYDNYSNDMKIIWEYEPAKKYLEQARGVLKVITLDEAFQEFSTK